MIWHQKVNYDCDATATTCETRQVKANIKTHTQFTWDENMYQEKKIDYGKFFDFCAEKCVYN